MTLWGHRQIELEPRECPAWVSLATTTSLFAVGPGPGQAPTVSVFNAESGDILFDFNAYDVRFTGGVRVAVGDINADGVPDILTVPGPGGGPHLRAFSGVDGKELLSAFVFESTFRGGMTIAVGDVGGDGLPDIVVGAGEGGGPRVRVLNARTLAPQWDFFAYESTFRGGVNVAVGDFGNGWTNSLVVGAGQGGGPVVKVFNGRTKATVAAFYAYESTSRGGVFVATGDVDNDGVDDLVTGLGKGRTEVAVFDPVKVKEKLRYRAGANTDTGGIRVAVVPANSLEGTGSILTASGAGDPAAIRLFSGLNGDEGQSQVLGNGADRAGYYVAGTG